MKKLFLSAALVALAAQAHAADLGKKVAPVAAPVYAEPTISATFSLYGGLAFDSWLSTYSGSYDDPASLGFDGKVNIPLSGNLGLQVGGYADGSWTSSSNWTGGIGSIGVDAHLYTRDPNAYALGLILGLGNTLNGYDEDSSVNYTLGVEGAWYAGPFTLYGQLAYLDTFGTDNYEFQNTFLAKLSGKYFVTPNTKIALTGEYLNGDYYYNDYSGQSFSLELEGEYKFAKSPVSIFASLREVWYQPWSGDYDTQTETQVKAGLRLFINQPTLLANDRNGPSFDSVFIRGDDQLNFQY